MSDGILSNHKVVSFDTEIIKKCDTKWNKCKARKRTAKDEQLFCNKIIGTDWNFINNISSPTKQVESLDDYLSGLMNEHFPLKITATA